MISKDINVKIRDINKINYIQITNVNIAIIIGDSK